jgi:hypothetical protein
MRERPEAVTRFEIEGGKIEDDAKGAPGPGCAVFVAVAAALVTIGAVVFLAGLIFGAGFHAAPS